MSIELPRERLSVSSHVVLPSYSPCAVFKICKWIGASQQIAYWIAENGRSIHWNLTIKYFDICWNYTQVESRERRLLLMLIQGTTFIIITRMTASRAREIATTYASPAIQVPTAMHTMYTFIATQWLERNMSGNAERYGNRGIETRSHRRPRQRFATFEVVFSKIPTPPFPPLDTLVQDSVTRWQWTHVQGRLMSKRRLRDESDTVTIVLLSLVTHFLNILESYTPMVQQE
jgi:hypothetical protein